MKTKKSLQILTIISILIFCLTSCTYTPDMKTSDIIAPTSGNNPLLGNWKVTNVVTPNSFSDDKNILLKWLGEEVLFTKNEAFINGLKYVNPSYKIKTVNTDEYFLNNYNVTAKSLDISDDSLKIITISVDGSFLNNFALITEDKMITYFDNLFIILEKDSLSEEELILADENNAIPILEGSSNFSNNSEQNKTLESGILLSLKHYEKQDYKIPYSSSEETYEPIYRTIWIDFNGAYVKSINELPYILLPRLNGFWQVYTDRVVNISDNENTIVDSLFVTPITDEKIEPEEAYVDPENSQFSSLLNVFYVGNDYISIEYNGTGFSKSQNRSYKYNTLRVLPIDTISDFNETPVPITELMGIVGEEALQQGAVSFLNSISEDTRNSYVSIPDTLNYGVERNEGKWTLIGRLNNSDEASKGLYEDFEIPTTAPKELVGFDSLYPTWGVIKEDFPDAIDAFTSPNQNFIIIIKENVLEGYKISDGVIQRKKLFTFDLKENEIPIMSQWSTGSYVKKWDEVFTDLQKSN